ncbi:hypothetical protein V6N13_024881 [Hibiscus sabdariffa]
MNLGLSIVLRRMKLSVLCVIYSRMIIQLVEMLLLVQVLELGIADAFVKHVGGHMSAHYQALGRLNDFKNQKTSISPGFSKQSDESTSAYRLRLEASITCLKWLSLQGTTRNL